MANYYAVCVKPSCLWTEETLIDKRIDAHFYSIKYMQYYNKLMKCKIKKMSLYNICSRMNSGPFGSALLASQYVDKGVAFIRPLNCKDYIVDIDNDVVFISKEDSERLKSSKFSSGDLIFTKIGNVGDVAIIPQKIFECNISGNLMGVKVKNNIDNYYVLTFLKSIYGQNQIWQGMMNSAMPKIDMDTLKSIVIPIPSPEIQKYIGDKVRKAEELREEAKRLKKDAEEILNRELNLNKLEESLKSSINSKHNWITSMDINDRIDSYYYKRRYILVNQHLNDYECIQIRDIASVDYGYMPTEDYADENNGVPLIRVTNMIGNLLLDLSDLKYISKSINIPDDKYVDDGDILVVQCGNTTGKIALMTKEVENYLYPSFCLRIKLRNKSINNKYLALLMEMSIIQEQIWQSASYSSVRPNTTKPAIENIRIPLIEKQKQEDVGALVEKYIDNIYQSKQLILEAKQDVEDLIEGNFDMSKVRANS